VDDKKIRVALAGAGAIGREQHLPGWRLAPEAEVEAIADPSEIALAAAAKLCPQARLVTDYRRILDDRNIDVVDICAPSALHAQMAIDALDAGKHVLCEKPMATSRADAAAVLSAADRSGKKYMVGHHLRFDPVVLQLRRYFRQYPLGQVYHARSQWLRRRRLPGRPGYTDRSLSGGGVLYDLGVHMFDLAWWLSGCPTPLTVSGAHYNHLARRKDLRGEWGAWDAATIDVEDFAAGFVRLAGGATMSLEVSWLGFQQPAETSGVEWFGTQSGAAWPAGVITSEQDGVPLDVRVPHRAAEKPHRELVRQFARAVIDDTPVPIPPHQCATAIAVLESLYVSAEQGAEQTVEAFGETSTADA
jgi:predicted dehydrogenase